MKNLARLVAGAAALAVAAPATAAALISVQVTGNSGSGAVWNTAKDGFWTVFIQQPFGNTLNPNDDFSGDPINAGMNNYVIGGEGFLPFTDTNSDTSYNILLRFADGAQIGGTYTFGQPGGGFTNGTSATVGLVTYTMNGFGWDRSRADNVSRFQAVSGGDPYDYTGQFSFNAAFAAVPEPTTWALFILGFGAIGAALRRRSSAIRVTKAKLRFS